MCLFWCVCVCVAVLVVLQVRPNLPLHSGQRCICMCKEAVRRGAEAAAACAVDRSHICFAGDDIGRTNAPTHTHTACATLPLYHGLVVVCIFILLAVISRRCFSSGGGVSVCVCGGGARVVITVVCRRLWPRCLSLLFP